MSNDERKIIIFPADEDSREMNILCFGIPKNEKLSHKLSKVSKKREEK